MKQYYERIKEIREDKDFLQKDIAKILEISTQQYSLYETGKREFKIKHIIEISRILNVSTDFILLGKK